jgi:Ca-activated chloride channel family protein
MLLGMMPELLLHGGFTRPAVEEAVKITALNARLSALATGAVPGDLAAVVEQSGGRIGTTKDPFALASFVADPSSERLAETEFSTLSRQDLGRWLLAFALIPCLFLFRRHA